MSTLTGTRSVRAVLILLTLCLTACGSSSSSTDNATDHNATPGDSSDTASRCASSCTVEETSPAYALAQGCFALKNDSGHYITATDESYAFSTSSIEESEKFFFKPTRLGSFLLYDRDGNYFAEDFLRITKLNEASERTEWKVNHLDIKVNDTVIDTQYTLISPRHDLRFQVINGQPKLRNTERETLKRDKTTISLVQQSDALCTEFPEAPLDAIVADEFYQEKDPSQPIVGYADVHTHIGFPKAMGGAAMAGEIFHPYGIEHALHDCAELHGKGGGLDFLEAQH